MNVTIRTVDPGPFQSRTLHRVHMSDLCAGCGGCAAVAPDAVSMHMSSSGWLRPVQSADLPAETEARIARICPGNRLSQDPQGRDDHVLWGPIVRSRTGFATDPALRRNASSGGVLSAIAAYLLESGEVDVVLQTGASSSDPVSNRSVASTTRAHVFDAAGSRYAPSAPLSALEDLLQRRQRVAFLGKPCDVSTLHALAEDDPRISEQVVVTLSFFCAGVPSRRGAREVLTHMGASEADVTAFRYRGDGWPGYARAQLQDGSHRSMSYAESWGSILSRHVQKRCKLCPDGTGGFADIVCADAWETDADGYPVFEERDGISLVLSRTAAGEALVGRAEAAGAITLEAFDPEGIAPMQPGQVRKRRYLLARLAAMRLLLRPVPHYSGFHLTRNAAAAGPFANLRQFGGMLRREIRALLGKSGRASS